MTEAVATTDGPLRPLDGPWGRATLVFQLALFMLPAITAWTSTANATIFLPLVALPTVLVAGLVMLALPAWRAVGIRVCLATLLAALLEVGLSLALIAAYSSQNPGWDLS
ncbi:hypothetical protein [Nocardioides caricicola]|uniref:Uncharacterized protein n=1 Tax=Nocardioides caricicola TaxID=634770 RepID=A0ABW0N0S8_9ACTN